MAKKWKLAPGAQQFWVCQQDRGDTGSYAKWFLVTWRECSSVSKWQNILVRQEPTTAMLFSPQTFGTSTNSAWLNGLRPPTGGNILLSLECHRLIIFISSLFRRSMDWPQRNGNWQQVFLAEDCNMLECVFKIVQNPAKSSPDSVKAILFQGTLTDGIRAKSTCHRSTAGNLTKRQKWTGLKRNYLRSATPWWQHFCRLWASGVEEVCQSCLLVDDVTGPQHQGFVSTVQQTYAFAVHQTQRLRLIGSANMPSIPSLWMLKSTFLCTFSHQTNNCLNLLQPEWFRMTLVFDVIQWQLRAEAILSLSARTRCYQIVCKVIPSHVTRMQFCLKTAKLFGAPRSQLLLYSLVLKPLAHPPIRLEWTDYDHRLVEISCFHWNVLGWSYSFRLFLEGPWTDGKEMEIGTWGSAILSLSARSRWYRIVCKVIPCHVTRMQFCLKMTKLFGAPRTNNCYAL